MKLEILHLYPKEMNLYGDHGNILAIQKRCKWRSIATEVIAYEPGDKFPKDVDIIFGGGGQDSGQGKIADDFLAHKEEIEKLIKNDVPALFVCGLYQLMGHGFATLNGDDIKGLGIFNVFTVAGRKRLVGNIIVDSPLFGEIVGFENHSGYTMLPDSVKPLGKVKKGAGNNNQDGTEGVIYRNAIGTYLHGPILPQNPMITDSLIQTAIANKYDDATLPSLDNRYEKAAHRAAAARPR